MNLKKLIYIKNSHFTKNIISRNKGTINFKAFFTEQKSISIDRTFGNNIISLQLFIAQTKPQNI